MQILNKIKFILTISTGVLGILGIIGAISSFALIMMFVGFGGIIGGVWLAFLGEWKLIGMGIFFMFIPKYFIGYLLPTKLIFALLAKSRFSQNKNFCLFAFFFDRVYFNIIVIAFFYITWYKCTMFYNGLIDMDYIPHILWSQGESVSQPLAMPAAALPYMLWSWGIVIFAWTGYAVQKIDNIIPSLTINNAAFFYFLFLCSMFISLTWTLPILIIWSVVQILIVPIFSTIYLARNTHKQK